MIKEDEFMKNLLNLSYGLVQGTYWMSYAVYFSFASVFLLARGYSNGMIGMILALGNILALIFQPFISDRADRLKRLPLTTLIGIMGFSVLLLTWVFMISESKNMMVTIAYILIISVINIMQPIITALSFKLRECGLYVNFGLTRSGGSMSYAVLCWILGSLVAAFGVRILPPSGELVFVGFIGALVLTQKIFNRASDINGYRVEEPGSAIRENSGMSGINIWQFISRHKGFFIVNIGVFGVFFSNQVLNGFMLQIVQGVGGSSQHMGRVFTLMAMLEIPTLIFYDRIRRKFSCKTLLKVSVICYVLQIATCYIAKDVSLIFVAEIFQPFAFALLLPSMVHIIDEAMEKGEAVKGQSMYTMVTVFSTITSTMIGGFVIDAMGIKALLLMSVIITSIGAATVIMNINKIK